jgi:hypothetical protein
MASTTLRPELPPLTRRLERLPVDRGYPVPWFVAWLDEKDGTPTERGVGTPDFRVIFPNAVVEAHRYQLCWLCGDRLGAHKSFVVGPMCAVTRASAEPPMHTDCAIWSVRGCPFLTRPHMSRREGGLPEGTKEPGGVMLRRNPGVSLVWTAKAYKLVRDPAGGIIFRMGDPVEYGFFAEGRAATRDEIDESFASGLPSLEEIAERQGPRAVRQLHQQYEQVRAAMLPA